MSDRHNRAIERVYNVSTVSIEGVAVLLNRVSLVGSLLTLSLLSMDVFSDAPFSAEPLPWPVDPPAHAAYVRAETLAELGREIFFDAGLSASRKQSCATCHNPATAFAPANARSVQLGGPTLHRAGTRATPSLAYLMGAPFFTEHFYESEDDGDESVDQGPAGGLTWDGRVNLSRDQAAIPLLDSNEMANRTEAATVARASLGPYATLLRELYGDDIFSDVHRAFVALGEALQAFEETPALFNAYTSKYDAFLRVQAQLSTQERRGLAVFEDPDKGNCIRCHKSQLSPAHHLPKFTDYGFVAIGVPRNRALSPNKNPNYFDLGICGPLRTDLANRSDFCGMFKAPSLRNVATRKSFYHNGIFHTLEQAVEFYATRDTNPERWYPSDSKGKVLKFDDLPAKYRGNVDHEAPFNREAGDAPAMSTQEVADVVAFLKTLNDGYLPPGQRVSATLRSVNLGSGAP